LVIRRSLATVAEVGTGWRRDCVLDGQTGGGAVVKTAKLRSFQTALTLYVAITRKKVSFVLDADIRGFSIISTEVGC